MSNQKNLLCGFNCLIVNTITFQGRGDNNNTQNTISAPLIMVLAIFNAEITWMGTTELSE